MVSVDTPFCFLFSVKQLPPYRICFWESIVPGGRTRDASDAILNYRAHFIEMRPETYNLKPKT